MAVNIIAAEDTKALTNKLKTSLQSSVGQIQVFSLEHFLSSKTTQSRNSVNVLFLTALALQDIQRLKKDDIKRLFAEPANTVVLCSCTESIKSAAIKVFARTVVEWRVVGLYEATGEEWYKAEARIKYRLSELENGVVNIPSASKYIIKPDKVSQLKWSDAEVLVILFETDQSAAIDKLKIKVGEKLFDGKKILSNVWSFCALDFSPGDHEIRVLADDIDLGTTTLQVQDCFVEMRNVLGQLKQEDPKRFLAELLQLDIKEFDMELVDYISSSNSVAVIEKILKYGDKEEHEYPTFLHFCAKYGLKDCLGWCKNYHPNFRQACIIENRNGKTPEMLATETNQSQLLIEALHTNKPGSEELELMTSPFKKSERFVFSNARKIVSCPDMILLERCSRDSGCSSSNGSGGSLEPSIPNASNNTRTMDERRRYPFGRLPHPYETIDDAEDDRGIGTYNRPWENKTILPNRSAKVLSIGSLPRSVADTKDSKYTKSTGLSRSNTSSGNVTKL